MLDRHATEVLAWVLLHSLWQGALVWTLFAAAMRLARRRRPEVRYAIGCVSLLAMLVAPLLTLGFLIRTLDSIDPAPLVFPGEMRDAEERSPFYHVYRTADGAPEGVAGWAKWVAANVTQQLVPWLAPAWLAGTGAFALRGLVGWLLLRRLVKQDLRPLRAALASMAELPALVGVKVPVQILETTLLGVPGTIGWLRPIVLLPVAVITGLPAAQLEAIVAHELAHIRRHDYLVNVLQTVAETLLFYHPAAWSISRRIRHEREDCCDDIAATVVGDRNLYARALVELEEVRPDVPSLVLSAAGGSLAHRVYRLAGAPGHVSVRRVRFGGGATGPLLACLLLLLVGDRLLAHSFFGRSRGLETVRPLSEVVYAELGVSGGAVDVVPVLADVLAISEAEWTIDTTRVVAEALNRDARPTALMNAFASRVDPSHATAEAREIGPFARRSHSPSRLAEFFARQARRPETSAADARVLARAALLLAAQDGMLVGAAVVERLLADRALCAAAGVDEAARARLLRHVDDHRQLDATFHLHVTAAMSAMNSVAAAPHAPPPDEVRATRDAMRAMAQLSRDRPDLQWRLAHLAWQLRSATQQSLPTYDAIVAGLESNGDPLARWLTAVRAQQPSPQPFRGIRTITVEELLRTSKIVDRSSGVEKEPAAKDGSQAPR